MSKRNTNEKPQNKRFDKSRKKEITKLLSNRYLIYESKKLVKFISLYIDCEATAKKYVQYYKSDKGLKNTDAFESLKYPEVEKAAKYFGLDIDSKLVAQIFKSGDTKRGERTPRQLRNGIFHSKAVKDIEEVEQRFEELSKLMETWLEKSKELIHRL
jgi:hypothetical protein